MSMVVLPEVSYARRAASSLVAGSKECRQVAGGPSRCHWQEADAHTAINLSRAQAFSLVPTVL